VVDVWIPSAMTHIPHVARRWNELYLISRPEVPMGLQE
jgi:hypothetical protein